MIRHSDTFITVRVCQIRQSAVDDISSISLIPAYSFALLSRCFFHSGMDSVINKLLFRKTWKDRDKEGNWNLLFFIFPLYIILVQILYHAQNTACIGPQRKKSEFYSTHFHTIICDGSLINHSFKSLILKIGIYEFDLLKWCVKFRWVVNLLSGISSNRRGWKFNILHCLHFLTVHL